MTWRASTPPVGVVASGVTWWVTSTSPDKTAQIAAIFRPAGPGPFPVVLYLHEARGVSEREIAIGPAFASAGFVLVIGCHSNAAFGCRTPPGDPVGALIDLSRGIPGARQGSVGLIGVSTGGVLAIYAAARRDDIAAIVADSGVSPGDLPKAPVLILDSARDLPEYLSSSRAYEQLRRERGLPVDAQYYDKGEHIVTQAIDTQQDATARAVAFLKKYLAP